MNGDLDAVKGASPVRGEGLGRQTTLLGVGRSGPILYSNESENAGKMVVCKCDLKCLERHPDTVGVIGSRMVGIPKDHAFVRR